MTSNPNRTALALFLVSILACSISAFAQESSDSTPEFVDKTITISYANIEEVYSQVQRLLSPRGEIIINRSSSSLYIRDTDEVSSRIEALVRQIDTPPHNIILTTYLISVEKSDVDISPDDVPNRVKEALREVTALLSYNSFSLIGTGMITINSTGRRGTITISDQFHFEFEFQYNTQSKYLRLFNSGLYHKDASGVRNLLHTDIGATDGDVVVLGVSKLNGGERAIMSVISVDVLP